MSQYLVNENCDDSQDHDHVTHTVNELQQRCEEQERIISRLTERWKKCDHEKEKCKSEYQTSCDKLSDSKNAYKHLHNMYENQYDRKLLTELELKHSKKQLEFMKSVVQSFERAVPITDYTDAWEQFETLEKQYKTAKEQLTQRLKRHSQYDKFPAWIDN